MARFPEGRPHEVLSFARAVVGDFAAAEIVAAETYRELIEGGTTVSQFFMALVANARNYLARQAYSERSSPLWKKLSARRAVARMHSGERTGRSRRSNPRLTVSMTKTRSTS
jgi:hypothetical protein